MAVSRSVNSFEETLFQWGTAKHCRVTRNTVEWTRNTQFCEVPGIFEISGICEVSGICEISGICEVPGIFEI